MPKDKDTPSAVSDLASLQAENAALKEQIAGFEAANKQRAADERVIAEKMSHGLTRDQAIAVIKRQREFDAKKKA